MQSLPINCVAAILYHAKLAERFAFLCTCRKFARDANEEAHKAGVWRGKSLTLLCGARARYDTFNINGYRGLHCAVRGRSIALKEIARELMRRRWRDVRAFRDFLHEYAQRMRICAFGAFSGYFARAAMSFIVSACLRAHSAHSKLALFDAVASCVATQPKDYAGDFNERYGVGLILHMLRVVPHLTGWHTATLLSAYAKLVRFLDTAKQHEILRGLYFADVAAAHIRATRAVGEFVVCRYE